MMKKAVFIIGLHRSGTSALAGYLHNAGLLVRGPAHGGDWKNRKGYNEDAYVLNINRNIFRHTCPGGYIDLPDEYDKNSFYVSDIGRISDLCRIYSDKYTSWLWKDPRFCLLLPLWIDELMKYISKCEIFCIFIDRDTDYLVHSWVNVFKWNRTKCKDVISKYRKHQQDNYKMVCNMGIRTYSLTFKKLRLYRLEILADVKRMTNMSLKDNDFLDNRLVNYR